MVNKTENRILVAMGTRQVSEPLSMWISPGRFPSGSPRRGSR
jgi:hypothetical protein